MFIWGGSKRLHENQSKKSLLLNDKSNGENTINKTRMQNYHEQMVKNALNQLEIACNFSFECELTSSVTTSWGVAWSNEYIARDLMQNFYDANRDSINKIKVNVLDGDVIVSAPEKFNLSRLFYLGSEKGDESVGQYGEGFKAAAVCLLRDHNVTPVVISGSHVVVLKISQDKVIGTELNPVVYEFYRLDFEYSNTALILPKCSINLQTAMKLGLTHFFYPSNPLLGQLKWTDGDFSIYLSTTKNGHVFYRNLKRGEISGIPVVLMINKECKSIETQISKDRDRNAFGEKIMELFYKTFARQAIQHNHIAQSYIVKAAQACWKNGHPLLSAICSYFRYNAYWSLQLSKDTFCANYFAKTVITNYASAKQIAISQMERQWQEQGKTALPSYFKHLGVFNADREIERLEEELSKESHHSNQRTPTFCEQKCMMTLLKVLKSLAPEVVSVFEKSTTHYSVIISDKVLGELKRCRSYRSHDVYLAERIFVGDFATAMATFLHEHAHIFGNDGSRGFTDALTEMFESVVRHRNLFDASEKEWNLLCNDVKVERNCTKPTDEDESAKLLSGMDIQDMRSLLYKVPLIMLKSLIDSEASVQLLSNK